MKRELKSLVRWQWFRFGEGRPRLSESLASMAELVEAEDEDEAS